MDTPTPMDATDGFTAHACAAPAFTDEIPPGCACAGCAGAARRTAADGARGMATLHGVRRAVVATVGAVALAGSAAGTAAAEPAPAHAGWDGSKYWFRNEAGAWRWTSHATTYRQRTGASAAAFAGDGNRTGEPVFRGRQGWNARDGVYWYPSRGHWYWTSHAWKYRQRTGLSGDTSKPSKPSEPPKPSAPSCSSRGWAAPVSSIAYTGYHGQRGSWSKGYHTGQDFAVPTGTTVRSVGPGRVVTAGYGRSYGYEVVIRHPDGTYTQYAHLSRIDVSPGRSVSAGQRIARSGATGRVTGPHLHFEVRTTPYFGSDINPLDRLRAHGVPV
ncbi:M23 family metallopeptidase [Streptomyces sp. NBC_00233]|uniref:M23 family metallopeptidase n=1 Tax=Streptomyces sp. NBC_00233 TaxID=2975686 RepID=UPI00225AC1C2|nr:M23 family metallopeptidase [Streptomyces sp. NBC_00233]MCX5230164.1 M23 family metallopeptidase [Streptomyces sp. NBC_00233]